jgi:exopolysaccharide production protein ExoZ
MENQRLDAVQGLRALAALLVVVAHSILSLIEKSGLNPAYEKYGLSSGALGVRIFFVISGFIMVYTSFANFAKDGASQNFFRKRLLRVLPFYYLATIIYCGKLGLQNNLPSIKSMFLSLLFIPYLNTAGLFRPIYGLGWTLNYEMFFYLLFSLALILKFRTGIAVISIALLSLVLAGTQLQPTAEIGFGVHWLIFASDPIMVYFVIGIVLSYVRVRTSLSLTSWPITTVLMVCSLISLFPVAGGLGGRALSVAMLITASACVALAGLRSSARDESSGLFRLRIIKSLGDASYSIYLTHSFLIGPAARGWAHMLGDVGKTWPLFVVAMLIGCSGLGLLTYRFVEKPMVDFLRKPKSRQPVFAMPAFHRATNP